MRWLVLLLYVGVLGYGIGFSFSPTFASRFERLQTDPGDTVLNHYFLEHSWRWASQRDYRGTLWSPPFFYPVKDVLAYSDCLFGVAPIYWLLRCGFDEVTAYQIWMMAGFACDFIAMVVVLRWFGLNHALCALGAFLFAFGLPNVQQIGHQQLTYRCWMPFAIWYGWRFLREPTAWRWFGCLFCIAWQFIAAVYVGWFLALGLGCAGVFVFIGSADTRSRLRRFVLAHPFAAAWPMLINGLLLATVVIPYLRGNEDCRRGMGEAIAFAPEWNSWLNVPPGTLWYRLVQPIQWSTSGEGYLCGGLTFFILAAAAIVCLCVRAGSKEDRLLIIVSFVTVLFLMAITLYFGDESDFGSLWSVVYLVVPGATAIRCISRVYLIVYPLWTIAGLLAMQRLLERGRPEQAGKKAVIAALIALAAVENFFPQIGDRYRSFAVKDFYPRAAAIGEMLHGGDAAFGTSSLPYTHYEQDLMMMWAGLYANVPVFNGYSGRSPFGYCLESTDASTVARLPQWIEAAGGLDKRGDPDGRWHATVVIIENNDPIKRSLLHLDGPPPQNPAERSP